MAIWDILAQGQTPRLIPSGQLIYLQSTPPDCFYYLISGSVRSFVSTPDGTERTLTIHGPGDLMGEASFFDQCPRVSSAMAITESRVVSVTWQRLNSLFAHHPELAMPMLQYLARTVRMLSDHVNSASLPAEQRIIRHLLSLPRTGDDIVSCTHESVGQAIGASRVTVSRVLGRLAGQGLIRPGYRSVQLIRADALRDILSSDE